MNRPILMSQLLVITLVSAAAGQHLDYAGSALWRKTIEIAVQGNYAYTAGANGMQIIDVSEPNEPILTSQIFFQGLSLGIDVSGNYAYVADKIRGLQIIDISDPQNPEVAGAYDNGMHIRKVAVSYPYCYFMDDSSMSILDVSDPEDPVEIGQLFGGFYNSQRDIKIRGDSCFVLYSSGFDIYEISDLGGLIYKSSGGIGAFGCTSLDVRGHYVYLSRNSTIYIFDASTSSAELVGQTDAGDYVYDIEIFGQYAWCTVDNIGLLVYDITYPAQPEIVGQLQVPGWEAKLAELAGRLYYVSYENDFNVINIANPQNPGIYGSIRGHREIMKVAANKSYAFAVERNTGIDIVDIGQSGILDIVSFIDLPDSVYWVGASDMYLSVLTGTRVLMIYDITDPFTPVKISNTALNTGTIDMFLDGSRIFSCSYPGNLNIIDLSDPHSPEVRTIYTTEGIIDRLHIEGNCAILLLRTRAKEIVSISDPDHAARLLLTGESTNVEEFCMDGPRYIEVTGGDYFKRYDLNLYSDPVSLIFINNLDLERACRECAINGFFAVANDIPDGWYPEDYGIRLFDVGDPLYMREIDLFKTPGYSRDLYLKGRYVYVADEYSMTKLDAHLPEPEEHIKKSKDETSLTLGNRPNPFNVSTSIQYYLPAAARVEIDLYDILGRKIETLVSGYQTAGSHDVVWSAKKYSSGVYFYKLTSGDFNEVKSCLLIK